MTRTSDRFWAEHASGGMRGRAVKGAAATSSAQLVKLATQFGSIIIFARLLTPSDFGLFAMIVPIVGLAALIQDLGLSQAVITAKSIDASQATAMFRINAAVAMTLAVIMGAAAPLFAKFYGEPRVMLIALAMSLQIVVVGVTVTHLALLSRIMEFGRVAIIDAASSVLAFACALALALVWPSVWVLVSQALLFAAFTCIGAWFATRWLPSRAASLAQVSDLLRFGAGMTGANVANFVSRTADNVLLGWYSGATQLGFYDRAYKLLLFPLLQINGPVSNVMIPILSRVSNDAGRYREAYTRTVRLLMMVTFPGVLAMIVTADQLIPFVMGERWMPAVPIFQWLGLAAVHQTISNTFGWLFVSQARSGEYARYSIFAAATCLVAFAIGLRWGAVGVAAAYGLSGLLVRLPVMIAILGRRGPVGHREITSIIAAFALAGGVGVLAWRLIVPNVDLPSWLHIGLSGAVIYAVAWTVIAVQPIGRQIICDIRGLVHRGA